MTTEKRIEIAAILAARCIQDSHDIYADATKRTQVCRAALAWADALAEVAEGDKPKTRYDWSVAPEWARWIATDKDGEVWAYEHKPVMIDGGWNSTVRFEQIVFEYDYCPHWRNSLEARPNA